jgi:hypothetical protein
MWRERLPATAVRILDVLIEAYPVGLDREDLAAQTALPASGGTFGAAVGMLRRYALVEARGRCLRASEVLVRIVVFRARPVTWGTPRSRRSADTGR